MFLSRRTLLASAAIAAPTEHQVLQAFAEQQFPEPSEFAGPTVEVHVVGIGAPSLSDRNHARTSRGS